MVVRLLGTALICLIMINTGVAEAASWPKSPNVEAKSWVLLDARSGQTLVENDSHKKLPPASLTKMMTLYLAFEDIKLGRLKLDETVSVSEKAWKIGGSTMFLEPRLHPQVEELLHGIATLSGNDACIALAEHVAGSEDAFADRMNRKAAELGMKDSHFVNATGFPAEDHYSSAYDMALLGAALWRDFPKHYEIFSERSYTYGSSTQPNRNRLLWTLPSADGIKTGHTQEAGFCLVASAAQDRSRLVSAVFGTDSDHQRVSQSRVLLQFGFRNFVTLRPTERDIRRQVEVYQGTEDHVWLLPAKPVWITVPKGNESAVSFRLRYPAPLLAPIAEGQKIGTIEAVMKNKQGEEVIASIPMLSRRAVAEASWFGRKWDALRLWWSSREDDEGTSSELGATEENPADSAAAAQ
ncbi:MAG: D-alanyl-D-alanine carboxypeptidase [Zetaproteobacteria bacterium CG12_big_fil_rev_8_21_14_0_65_55_1124]|nr:MAG: D-alanyl-D-alanine carboxypeptidase [Zetaproteobacteria bacterium CG1_02_55_237]PIS20429.1 MAG: D-alanyl-D-alanine carboxypeptidase [Zetaproteobacteria bacterium CG08_land_8_20_14_0_20_55_17]PIW42625.1 MAG: D-alanyl-D-alanine carboxypeptidase [Zetaproteobacteria bacterium CG12_big_fil_rev_8_21_14_0_65_55_1124]PIY54232.1 MAG: D-alanyl-D-alanine carboxypeptidase [Zetaproteobacteria bacterium CG_4_10_14_0_8_um_filter_55_43]PIZ38340.1 MAG: D-alanyl-D-alanine carboxypeptidase [Zetaproteobact